RRGCSLLYAGLQHVRGVRSTPRDHERSRESELMSRLLPEADLTRPPVWRPTDPPSIGLPGGTRSTDPRDTIERVRPLFDDLGVEHFRIDVNEPFGVPIYWAYQVQKFHRGYGQREWNFGGKGLTEDLAFASMVMESCERIYGSRIHHPELVR